MDQYFTDHWQMIVGRVYGPFAFRFILQPLVVTILACRDGVKDARIAKPAYGWAVVTNSADRRNLVRQGWKTLAKVFIAAITIDLIYEVIVFHRIYPGQSLIVATLLALAPYPFIRGLVNRIARRWRRRQEKTTARFQAGSS
jgi:hypothetical protein